MRLLTNCFRVIDPRFNEWVQAEIGVDISDLELHEEHHRTIRDVGKRMQELKTQSEMQEFVLTKQYLQLRLRDGHLDKKGRWDMRNLKLSELGRQIEGRIDEKGRQQLAHQLNELINVKAQLDKRYNELDTKINDATHSETLAQLRTQVNEFAAEPLPDEFYT